MIANFLRSFSFQTSGSGVTANTAYFGTHNSLANFLFIQFFESQVPMVSNYRLWLLDSLPRCSVDQMNRAFSLPALCGDHFTRRTSPIHKSTSQASSPEFLFLLRLFIPPPPPLLLIYNTSSRGFGHIS